MFEDASLRLPEVCCTQTYNGTYRPEGKLAEFIGASMTSVWYLKVEDYEINAFSGTVLSYSLHFTSSPCVKRFSWTNLTQETEFNTIATGSTSPAPRFESNVMTYREQVFMFGGRDEHDRVLQDLYRFDTRTFVWTTLTPVDFNSPLDFSNSVGANFLMTSWGLIRFGGYYRQPYMTEDNDNYGKTIFVLDPVTMRWQGVAVTASRHHDRTFGRAIPAGRYLSAMAFVSSHNLQWRSMYKHRSLYDQTLRSIRTNYQGVITDSIVMFGGFDGATGTIFDGSNGGYQNDMWMLRLGNWSTSGNRYRQQTYLEQHCRWRVSPSAINKFHTQSCLGGTGSACYFRDLLLLAWCSGTNQTMT